MSAKKPLPGVDPDVVVPSVVKTNSKKSDDLHAQFYPKEPAVAPPQDTPTETVPLVVTPQVTAPDAPPAPVDAPPAPQDPVDWEHRYKSMKGRNERQVEQIAHLQAAVADLQQEISVRAPASEIQAEKLITEKELADYGPELLDVVGKKAREDLSPMILALQKKVEQLEGQLRGTTREVVKTARQRMFETLEADCPQWHQLNEDPNFLSWLQLPDRFSGVIRSELLNTANERNDTPRVVAFFQGYLEEAARNPAIAERGLPAPAMPAPVPSTRVPLETLAAPGRATSTAASSTAPVAKPIITRADITTFYANKAAGRYTEAQAVQYEQTIHEAAREGRIR